MQAALNQVAELNEQAKIVKRSSTPGQDPSSCTMDESHSMTMEQCSFDVSSLMADQTLSKPNDDLVAEKTKMEHDLRNANN